jgi:PIN domain nuclease of toxin-antitoxin system
VTSVVADSHAILWYVQGSDRLSEQASSALASAEAGGGIVVSVARSSTWYVTQTTESMSSDDLGRLRRVLSEFASVDLHPIDVSVVDAATSIPREVLTDPWDRFIVATATALDVSLVTRDRAIAKAALVETIW